MLALERAQASFTQSLNNRLETKMTKTLLESVRQLITMASRNAAVLNNRLVLVDQPFPDAMFADQVVELDVRDQDPQELLYLTHVMVNSGMAVQRLTMQVNTTTHLRIWAIDERSACSRQRSILIEQLRGFQFVDGWQWRGDDPRDLVFEIPRRLSDERTWVMGAYYGLEDGGPHGIWNRGTFLVTFADRNSTEIAEVALYCKNGGDVFKMTPGTGFVKTDTPPALLF